MDGSAASTHRECDSLVLLNSRVRSADLPGAENCGHKTMNGGTKIMKLSSTFGEGFHNFLNQLQTDLLPHCAKHCAFHRLKTKFLKESGFTAAQQTH